MTLIISNKDVVVAGVVDNNNSKLSWTTVRGTASVVT